MLANLIGGFDLPGEFCRRPHKPARELSQAPSISIRGWAGWETTQTQGSASHSSPSAAAAGSLPLPRA